MKNLIIYISVSMIGIVIPSRFYIYQAAILWEK